LCLVELYNDDLGFNVRRKFCVRVVSLEEFETFESLLEKHLLQALPTVKSVEFGCQILNQYYAKDNEAMKKLAIKIERISAMVNVSLTTGSSC
jgi:ASC-1-like (ASCH) protein